MNDNNNAQTQSIQKKTSNIDIKGKKTGEYSGNDIMPPLSRSAPQNSWLDEQQPPSLGRKIGDNNSSASEPKHFSLHTDNEPLTSDNNDPKQQTQHQKSYHDQRYRRKGRARSPPIFDELPPKPMGFTDFTMIDIHQLIEEVQGLRYELEAIYHQFQLEKLEYQRRLRHLAARVQYLEDLKRQGQSPGDFLNEIKPYHTGRKFYKRKQQPKNEDEENCATTEQRYLSDSPDPMIQHDKKRHFPPPPFPFDERRPFYQYDFMDRYGMMPPPPHPPMPGGNTGRHMFEQEEQLRHLPYMRYFYEGSPYLRHDYSDNEDDIEDEGNNNADLDDKQAEAAMNDFYQRGGHRYGPHPPPPPPPPPPPHPGMHPPPPPPPPFMSGPPPMMYGRPWRNEFSSYPEGQRRPSQHEKAEKFVKSPIMTADTPDDEDIEMMIHQMSLSGPPPPPPNMMGVPPPPPPPPPMMYRDLAPPFNKGPLRRVSSRRSGEYHPNGGSSRSSFIGSR